MRRPAMTDRMRVCAGPQLCVRGALPERTGTDGDETRVRVRVIEVGMAHADCTRGRDATTGAGRGRTAGGGRACHTRKFSYSHTGATRASRLMFMHYGTRGMMSTVTHGAESNIYLVYSISNPPCPSPPPPSSSTPLSSVPLIAHSPETPPLLPSPSCVSDSPPISTLPRTASHARTTHYALRTASVVPRPHHLALA